MALTICLLLILVYFLPNPITEIAEARESHPESRVMRTLARDVQYYSRDDEIVFSLTKGLANTYPAKVIVKKVGTSNEVPCTLSAPVITGLDKTEGKQNDPVKISGKYFGIKKSKVQCVAGDGTVKSAKVVGYSDTQLDVLVPKVGVGTYQLKVQNAAGISSPVSFTVK